MLHFVKHNYIVPQWYYVIKYLIILYSTVLRTADNTFKPSVLITSTYQQIHDTSYNIVLHHSG